MRLISCENSRSTFLSLIREFNFVFILDFGSLAIYVIGLELYNSGTCF